MSDTTMRPQDLGPQHTGRARVVAQQVAAARAVTTLSVLGARIRSNAGSFDTGMQYGPAEFYCVHCCAPIREEIAPQIAKRWCPSEFCPRCNGATWL